MKNNKKYFIVCMAAVLMACGSACPRGLAQDIAGKNAEPVELNGDTIEYKAEEGKFVAAGNVYLKQNDAVLFCDKLEFYRDKKEAHAQGNVILESPQGRVWAEKAFYNFETKKGEFTNARLMADPIYGRGRSVVKVRENYYVLNDGYLTTSDYDDPEYRIKARRMDVYPGDRAVARDAVMYLGGVPVMYMPKYTQYLDKNRPHISVIPGYKKEFGGFLLTTYRTNVTDRIETIYHLDWRELKGAAGGVDVKYNAEPYGQGLVRTYYMNERNTAAKRVWEDTTTPVVERQRYRVEWRHMAQLDPSTSFIGQYYKVTDNEFLKKYFRKEYHTDSAPPTYAMLTHTTPVTTTSLRADVRVNRFESAVERLPEAAFSLSNQQLGDTGLYFKSSNTVSSLVQKNASPSDIKNRTLRVHTDNELSRPFKVSFLEFRPYAGTEQTYNSRTLNRENDDAVRGVFRTGSDVSTKFYKVYDVNFRKYGVEVNRLRHVITPTVGYLYQHAPTMPSEKFYQYDSIDARARIDKFSLGLENKLQTKRNGTSVDLLRVLLSTDFRLKDNPSSGSFGDVTVDTDFTPNQYLSFYSDMTYDNDRQHLRTANFDMYINSQKNWAVDLSRRYTRDDDDIVTARWEYKLNPKWRVMLYERCDVDSGKWKEQQYALVRDLHSWEVEFAVKNNKGYNDGGNEIWIIFRLKAFPSVSTGSETSFSHIAAGAAPVQRSE